jgi:hypothetical protein
MNTYDIHLRVTSPLSQREVESRIIELWLANCGDKNCGDYVRIEGGEKRCDATEVGTFTVLLQRAADG